MTGFEMMISGVGNDRATNWATTTALKLVLVFVPIFLRDKKSIFKKRGQNSKVKIADRNFWSIFLPVISLFPNTHTHFSLSYSLSLCRHSLTQILQQKMWRLCLVASVQLIQRKSRIKKTRTRGYEKEQKGKPHPHAWGFLVLWGSRALFCVKMWHAAFCMMHFFRIASGEIFKNNAAASSVTRC